jgi:hypothetical protein
VINAGGNDKRILSSDDVGGEGRCERCFISYQYSRPFWFNEVEISLVGSHFFSIQNLHYYTAMFMSGM